jgi:hypothetical protein
MTGSESSNPIAAAHARAYRAYLQTLKEAMADVDIEAVSLSTAAYVPGLATYYTIATYLTYSTYNTYHTINTINSIHTVATESSIE